MSKKEANTDKVLLYVYMEPGLATDVKVLAARSGVSYSSICEEGIRFYLDAQEKHKKAWDSVPTTHKKAESVDGKAIE